MTTQARVVGRGRFGRAARLGVARSRVLRAACWRLGLGVPGCTWHDMCGVAWCTASAYAARVTWRGLLGAVLVAVCNMFVVEL